MRKEYDKRICALRIEKPSLVVALEGAELRFVDVHNFLENGETKEYFKESLRTNPLNGPKGEEILELYIVSTIILVVVGTRGSLQLIDISSKAILG